MAVFVPFLFVGELFLYIHGDHYVMTSPEESLFHLEMIIMVRALPSTPKKATPIVKY